ncbi:MAG: beta-glucosidase BglX [Cyclobacteriaceae bacterium]|nr:beta-glucosidase BglX [Cyclobacteriaceae bacterium]
MIKSIVILLFCLFSARILSAQDAERNTFIDGLLNEMTIEEKIGQLNLVAPGGFTQTGPTVSEDVEEKIRNGQVGAILNSMSFDVTKKAQEIAVNTRLKIPLLFGMDVIHGHSTIFPIPLGLASTWDMALIERSARIAAVEASAHGINWTFSPMVDIARDARWGRIAEGAGEDPWLGSQVARAFVNGFQGENLTDPSTLMACVKHMALYGASEAGRDYNTVDMSRVAMFNYFLPPYKAAIDAGVGSVMTSFNVVDGIPATGNKWLLTDVLRDRWGFDGFIVSDYTSVNEMIPHGMGDLQQVSALALKAGLDMDMVGEGFLTTLKKSLEEGKVTEKDIDTACRRVLEAKYMMGLFADPFKYLDSGRLQTDVVNARHLQAAREIAAHSIVLLKNENQTLPLEKSGTIALVGPLADNKDDLLGTWVLVPDRNRTVSIREGIADVAGGNVEILYARGANITDDPYMQSTLRLSGPSQEVDPNGPSTEKLLDEAVIVARKADVIVAVLGESFAMSGEAASRADIGIPESQQELLRAMVNTGKPVVLVLVNGRPLTLTWENENTDAILETWAGGTEAGHAIADVLFGDYNPAGKLTVTFPRHVGQIPLYYNHLRTGRPMDPNNKYTSKYLDVPNDPLFPFGYGLSYTSFEYGELNLSKKELTGNDSLTVSVIIRNTGGIDGEEIAQLYLQDPAASITRPVKELKNFRKLMIKKGEQQEVTYTITTDDLKFYDSNLDLVWEPGEFIIYVGTNSRDVQSASVNWIRN